MVGQRRRLSSGGDQAAGNAGRRSRRDFLPESDIDQKPVDIAQGGHRRSAHSNFIDVVIVDTAGRLHIDAEMMDEIKALHAAINPVETLFVVDAMTGQDAANTAKAFNDALPLTGVILTKADGDARGGAALSVRPSPASRSSSSVSARRPKRSIRSTRIGSPRASSAWATCSVADRGGRADDRQGQGRQAGQEAQEGQGLRPRGSSATSCSR